jgi:hypothetical protein
MRKIIVFLAKVVEKGSLQKYVCVVFELEYNISPGKKRSAIILDAQVQHFSKRKRKNINKRKQQPLTLDTPHYRLSRNAQNRNYLTK